MKIGVFDSGLGGITVLKELIKNFPQNEYIYYADLENMPYGSKTVEELNKIGINIINKLREYNVDKYICACGTLSSVAMKNMHEMALTENKKVYGIIESIRGNIEKYNGKRILIIATPATISRGLLKEEISKTCDKSKIYDKACDEFVYAIENFQNDEEYIQSIAEKYLDEFQGKVDVVVCGCTHYVLYEKYIKNILGDVILVEAGNSICEKMSNECSNRSKDSCTCNKKISIIYPKDSIKFKDNASKILVDYIENINFIDK
ncbi:MAG: glutamate racemase [Clostridia bacterium]|nr:glutamate racemase [Clostridia bacterium]